MKNTILLPRCEDEEKGLILEKGLNCKTVVIAPNGTSVEPIDYDGVNYIPCKVGDIIMHYYNKDKKVRSFKVLDVERSGHFFICEIIYDEEEMIEIELISLAEQVESGDMTTNIAHLKADQLLVSFLYKKGFVNIADAFNKVPKYYE